MFFIFVLLICFVVISFIFLFLLMWWMILDLYTYSLITKIIFCIFI
nr:MAG TPA: hypothetical protein [Caudoviricetes sp.]